MTQATDPIHPGWLKVDRASPIPYYVQVIQAIHKQIEDGHLPVGSCLAGESDLCEMSGVSRAVIRQALGRLVNEGLLVRLRGKGTFITRPKIGESLVQRLTGFYDDMVQRGYTPVTQVMEQKIEPAMGEVAHRLRVQEGEPVLKLTRKRSIDGVPIVLVTTYLPHRLCRGIEEEDFSKQSLYRTLEDKYGLYIVTGERSLEAVPASESEAHVLEMEEGAPLVSLDSIGYLDDGTPLEFYHAVHRGDRTRFEVALIRYEEPAPGRRLLDGVASPPQGSAILREASGLPRSVIAQEDSKLRTSRSNQK